MTPSDLAAVKRNPEFFTGLTRDLVRALEQAWEVRDELRARQVVAVEHMLALQAKIDRVQGAVCEYACGDECHDAVCDVVRDALEGNR